jgi:hypothetical protein
MRSLHPVALSILALTLSTSALSQEQPENSVTESIVAIQANNCGAPTPNGYFWVGNPSVGTLCSTGLFPPTFVSYYDKPVGTTLQICPGQYVPANWSVRSNTIPMPTWCPGYSIRGTKWVVVRTS